jgi:hypothetical protein
VDAHSRGRADETDSADQWVLDLRTGNDELRLNNSGTESPGPSRTPNRPAGRGESGSRAEASGMSVGLLFGGDITGAATATVIWPQDEQGVAGSTNRTNAPAKTARVTPAYTPGQAGRATALGQGAAGAEGDRATVLTPGAGSRGAGVPVIGPAEAPEDMQRASADKAERAK